MQITKELKRIYFNDRHAIIVDETARTYCFITDRLGILKVKDMFGLFIFHENLTQQEKMLRNQKYLKDGDMIDRFRKI